MNNEQDDNKTVIKKDGSSLTITKSDLLDSQPPLSPEIIKAREDVTRLEIEEEVPTSQNRLQPEKGILEKLQEPDSNEDIQERK